MKRLRVFIGEMPRLQGDILADAVSAQPDMEVIGRGTMKGLTRALQGEGVDVVILREGIVGRHLTAQQLLLSHPNLRVITLAHDGRIASLFEIRELTLIEPSPAMLIDAIRMAQRGGPAITRHDQ